MLAATALVVLNHLLDQTPGAHARLVPHAGALARLECGGAGLSFAIADSGRLEEAAGGTPVVVIRLPADAPLRFAHEGDAVLRDARIEGDAALAETLGKVLRSLRWDAAEDLSRLVGDAAAERLVGAARSVQALGNDLAARLATATSEYVADEAQMLVRPAAAESFAGGVDTLRDDVARLQKRLELLERAIPPGSLQVAR